MTTIYGPCPNCSIGLVNSNTESEEADASCGVCPARWKGGIGDWTALPPNTATDNDVNDVNNVNNN